MRARGAVAARSFVTRLHRCPLVTSNPSTAQGSVLAHRCLPHPDS
ncbi:hypothetical protein XCR_1548 [Xanthomonas campestris pv. raphani 756C]|nr:hypothetical protein XCR_1548 [Xanthomonas campestris pv. raphani 756C]